MDIEELLKEGPSLTLTPEAAPELPAEEKKAEPKVYEEEQYLTEEETGGCVCRTDSARRFHIHFTVWCGNTEKDV